MEQHNNQPEEVIYYQGQPLKTSRPLASASTTRMTPRPDAS